MQDLMLIVIIYYLIMLILLLLSLRKYLTSNDYIILIFLLLIFLSSTLTILGLLIDLDILSLEKQVTNCLDALEYSIELPELNDNLITDKFKEIPKVKNPLVRFLELFINNSENININKIPNELKNSYYINNIGNKNKYNPEEWSKFIDNAMYTSLHNKEVIFLIECCNDLLDTLESVNTNIKNKS